MCLEAQRSRKKKFNPEGLGANKNVNANILFQNKRKETSKRKKMAEMTPTANWGERKTSSAPGLEPRTSKINRYSLYHWAIARQRTFRKTKISFLLHVNTRHDRYCFSAYFSIWLSYLSSNNQNGKQERMQRARKTREKEQGKRERMHEQAVAFITKIPPKLSAAASLSIHLHDWPGLGGGGGKRSGWVGEERLIRRSYLRSSFKSRLKKALKSEPFRKVYAFLLLKAKAALE